MYFEDWFICLIVAGFVLFSIVICVLLYENSELEANFRKNSEDYFIYEDCLKIDGKYYCK